MIDLAARTQLAQSARWLIAGRITNYQFDDGVPSSMDPAVNEIYSKAFWLLYCDLREYRLSGNDRVAPDVRTAAARSILFLKSGLPYEWPVLSRSSAALLVLCNLLTLGYAGRKYLAKVSKSGDVSLWPFRTKEQYAKALEKPPYLGRL